jgi:hypothetical protein
MRLLTRTGAAILGVALLYGVPAAAQVGVVRTVEGPVNVFSGRQECAPRYGLDLEEGDAVRTGPKAWALLSMMDGAKITVRPDTEVRIVAYRYTDAGESVQNNALLALASGAVRVSAGRITLGRSAGFRVQTPHASVELRGADHDVAYVDAKSAARGDSPLGTYGKAIAGEAVIRTTQGQATAREGQIGFVEPAARAAPRILQGAQPYFYHWHSYIDRRVTAVVGKLDATLP